MARICPDCGNMIAYNSYFSAFYCPRCGGIFKKVKPMTNADRIRAMSDEELADVVANGVGCVRKAPHCMDDDCTPCIRKWLQQPAEGE